MSEIAGAAIGRNEILNALGPPWHVMAPVVV